MSDLPIDPSHDGSGGGLGRFTGKTVRELAVVFDLAASSPVMSSVTAVLRIAREQLEVRQELAPLAPLSVTCFAIAGVLMIASLFCGEAFRLTLLRFGMVTLLPAIAFLMGHLRNRHTATTARIQDQAIRDLALDAITRVVGDPEFKARALDREQLRFMKGLLKRSKRTDRELLEFMQEQVRLAADTQN